MTASESDASADVDLHDAYNFVDVTDESNGPGSAASAFAAAVVVPR